jgi:Na+-transporting NADH:ubiquinone oxidoreductase subunit C
VYDPQGDVAFAVNRSPGSSPYQVDLISGASVTSKSLGDVVRFWMGTRGYGPVLARLRNGETTLSPP